VARKFSEGTNLFDLIPGRQAESVEKEGGRVSLLVPRFRNKLLSRIAMRLGRSEYVQVHLDEEGSRVWNLIDGSRTVKEIGQELHASENEEERYRRLAEFITILKKNLFIDLTETPRE